MLEKHAPHLAMISVTSLGNANTCQGHSKGMKK